MILRGIEVGPLATNCYIVGDDETKEAMVVDAGDDPDFILDHIKELGVKVLSLVNTHGHSDHIWGIKKLKDATGALFAIHEADVPILDARVLRAGSWWGRDNDPPPAPDRLLHDGDTVRVGELAFTVLHTPGHTPGGICLLGHGVVFTGDTLFRESIGRYDFPGGNYAQLIASIKSKLVPLPDDIVVLPGHGPQSTMGHEKENNPFLY
jgi:glyoxylase-like metal-dependent hydrolase (beta-lactamase superfamily II)